MPGHQPTISRPFRPAGSPWTAKRLERLLCPTRGSILSTCRNGSPTHTAPHRTAGGRQPAVIGW